jgi:catechol 2,3-dioxygenase-like lactoylglutathione lyase family enzyme
MKRFHVHVAVDKLDESIRFYSALFGHAPTVAHVDYAKWMLEDPRINFAISQRGRQPGINHIGFQVDSPDELSAMRLQLDAASGEVIEQQGINCCYARSDKHWVTDPSGIAWETFRTLGDAVMYGDQADRAATAPAATPHASACSAPTSTSAATEHGVCCR